MTAAASITRAPNRDRLYLGTHTAGLRPPRTGLAERYAREAARRAELDRLRTERGLTLAEVVEHDRLINRLYMRVWRKANTAAGQVQP